MVRGQISSGRRAEIIRKATAAARKDWVAYTRTQEAEIYRLFEQAADRLHRQILASQKAGVLPPARLVNLLGDPKNPHPDSVLGVMRDLRPRLSARIQKGMSKSVDFGLHTQIAAATAAVGTNRWKTGISSGKWATINTDAMDALVRFKPNGIMFSSRVWKISNDTQTYLRNRINQAVALGEPVQNVARDIQKYLVEPNKLFRRVRDPKTGKLRLSRAARDYHPGRGVYRSAHANAMRVAQTEMSRAYNEGAWRYMQEKKWIDGGIWRTVHFSPCPECIALEDRFFPKDAMPAQPLHPWCYCQWEFHTKGEDMPAGNDRPLPAEVRRHLALAPERQKRGRTPAKVKAAAGKTKVDKPITPTLANAKTTDELEQWARAEYPHMTFDFKGGHMDMMRPTMTQFKKLAKLYPDVANNMQYIGTGLRGTAPHRSTGSRLFSSANTWAHASYSHRAIGLNSVWYGDPAKFRASLANSAVKTPNGAGRGLISFHPTNCDTVESVMTHEFGHLLDDHLIWKVNKYNYLPFIKADGFGSVSSAWWNVRKTRAGAKLSTYATTNDRERMAEAFSAIHHSPAGDPVHKMAMVKRTRYFLDNIGTSTDNWRDRGPTDYYSDWIKKVSVAERAKMDARVAVMKKGLGIP